MALIFILFLAQALLREPSRGGHSVSNELAPRFKCAVDGDWSRLMNHWEKDIIKLEGKIKQKP